MDSDGPDFNGPEYVRERDHSRLTRQHERIRELMRDGSWRTLVEIATATGDPAASISAQLRHLRKARFGGWTVEKRHRGEPRAGLYEYRLSAPETVPVLCQTDTSHADGAEHADSKNKASARIHDASDMAVSD